MLHHMIQVCISETMPYSQRETVRRRMAGVCSGVRPPRKTTTKTKKPNANVPMGTMERKILIMKYAKVGFNYLSIRISIFLWHNYASGSSVYQFTFGSIAFYWTTAYCHHKAWMRQQWVACHYRIHASCQPHGISAWYTNGEPTSCSTVLCCCIMMTDKALMHHAWMHHALMHHALMHNASILMHSSLFQTSMSVWLGRISARCPTIVRTEREATPACVHQASSPVKTARNVGVSNFLSSVTLYSTDAIRVISKKCNFQMFL